jgi:hypothetical protein
MDSSAMVIVRLNGGLGNQLFQYATGRALAHRMNAELKVDLVVLNRDPRRGYGLQYFEIAASTATPQEAARLSGPTGRLGRMYRSLNRLLPCRWRTVVSDRHSACDITKARFARGVYLIGYWQREKYFRAIEFLLRRELTVRGQPDARNRGMLELISQTQSVSLHVRRGDYVADAVAYRYHGVCPISYYDASLKLMAERVPDLHLFVFSDDIEWTQQNLRCDHPTTFVDHNGVEKDYEDLRLMANCKHHIIANSSFSWWGAWLAPYTAKTVVAPKRWFREAGVQKGDPVPMGWIRL